MLQGERKLGLQWLLQLEQHTLGHMPLVQLRQLVVQHMWGLERRLVHNVLLGGKRPQLVQACMQEVCWSCWFSQVDQT